MREKRFVMAQQRQFASVAALAVILLVATTFTFNNNERRYLLVAPLSPSDDTTSRRNEPGTQTTDYDPLVAQRIVHDAYQNTYAHFDNPNHCPQNTTFLNCLRETQKKQQTNTTSWPWWFQTLLRDASPSTLFGSWHHLLITDPRIEMCVIEKIGTKHWRQVQCQINQPVETANATGPLRPCHPSNNTLELNRLSASASKTVFLRDPLERFLSGFIDKCEYRLHIEPHCEPQEVFQNVNGTLTERLFENKRQYFEAYVDTMPLRWNLHFFPQSMYCDGLFRHIQDYDFVGRMGPSFYQDVQSLSDKYHHTNLTRALESVFDLEKNLHSPPQNVGVEASASSHVQEYYTPHAVRRVLQYMSIDYILLDLPIPEWAHEMLQQ